MKLPENIIINEVGPRDGFQYETKIIPTSLKIDVISALIEAGLTQIQVASFVNPKIMPQMADAKAVINDLPDRPDLNYSALILNKKGLDRAIDSGIKEIEVSISASDIHGRKNTGMSFLEALEQGRQIVGAAVKHHLRVCGSIQCVLGCVYEGDIPFERIRDLAQMFISEGIYRLSLADTTGMGNPLSVSALLEKILPIAGGVVVSLHLHDTRGLGLANVYAGLLKGVTTFDTSVGGMGGCPFVTGAAGNIATEDTVNMLNVMGIESGITMERLIECTFRLEKFLGKNLPSKMSQLQKNMVL